MPYLNSFLSNSFVNVPSSNLAIRSLSHADQSWSTPTNVYPSGVANSMSIECQDELKSPSTESVTTEQTNPMSPTDKSPLNDNDMKTEFVNFRKKQFETGHVENIVRDPQRESKTKKYSEKKKYETEWNRLTAIADVESVMERASHFEDIDPDKFARLRSKLPTSPPIQENSTSDETFVYDLNPSQNHFYDHSNQGQFKMLKPATRQSSLDSSSSLSMPRGSCAQPLFRKRHIAFCSKVIDISICFLSVSTLSPRLLCS